MSRCRIGRGHFPVVGKKLDESRVICGEHNASKSYNEERPGPPLSQTAKDTMLGGFSRLDEPEKRAQIGCRVM